MKFILSREPKDGDTRTITRFLFLPKVINREIRWLERASWNEIYVVDSYAGFEGWDRIGWNNEIEKFEF